MPGYGSLRTTRPPPALQWRELATVSGAQHGELLEAPPAGTTVRARATFIARAGLTDGQRPPLQRRAMEPRDGGLGLGGDGHLHEAKPPRLAAGLIRDQPDGVHGPVSLGRGTKVSLGHGNGEIPHLTVHGLRRTREAPVQHDPWRAGEPKARPRALPCAAITRDRGAHGGRVLYVAFFTAWACGPLGPWVT